MEFRKVKLKELSLRITKGTTPNKEAFNGSDVTYIKSDSLNFNGFIDKKLFVTIDEKTHIGKLKRSILKENDILYSIAGAYLGKVGIVKKEYLPANTNQAVGIISLNNNVVFPKYIYYYLQLSKIRYFANNSISQSAQPNINLEQLGDFDINICELEEQKKIVRILDSITRKIELNNLINDNLYELLKVEFKTKFYNKNSDAKLLDFISNTIGGDWGKELPVDNYNTKVYCVRGADIPNMEYGNKWNAPTRYILEKNYNNKKLKPNNIIIEISGGSPTQSTGRTAYITENILNMYDAPLLCTNFCRAIETKKNIYAPFVYMYLTLMYEDDIFFNWENGTTGIKNLALNDLLLNIEITQPNEEELNKYYILFNSIMNKISNNSNENIKLELLRDTLLPKLMNGEIDLDKIEIYSDKL